jgi:hypothetical protein
MRNVLLLCAALLLSAGAAFAQSRNCSTMEVLERQLQENPAMLQIREQIEQQTQQFIQSGGAHDRTVITIPVVFHVVWNTSAENLSDARLMEQLTVLTNDFRRTNADASNTPSAFAGVAADTEVQFCLAQQDPSGNATTGIVRVQTSVTSFSDNDAVKYTSQGGSNAWDRTKYLNFWVCDLGGGLLGYAQFPGGPAATDGVVCDYAYVGVTGASQPYHLGRTATHEVGHWLNCYHIWGDDGTACTGSDLVGDTPNQSGSTSGCPTFPTVSCSNGPNGNQFMNYMDYSYDACMNMFSAGQKARMQAVLAPGGSRASLAASPGCQPPSGGGCGTPGSLNATNITSTSATLNWGSVSGATGYNLQWKTTAGSTWTTVSGLGALSYGLSGLTASTSYDFRVQAVCGGTSGTYSATASFTTQSGGGCVDQYEPNNTYSAAVSIPVGTQFTAQIATSTDKDYYKFNNTSTLRNVKVDLTTLPYDYDIRLYRNGTQVAISQNGGTLNEVVKYNTSSTTIATYVAYVYGYNGAYSNSLCYTLKASRSSTAWREDGSTEGEVEEIEIPVVFGEASFGLFPNPASQSVTVEVPLEADGDVSVAILDPSGKQALAQTRRLTKGDNRMEFQLGELPAGVYFVQVRNGELAMTRKLVVNGVR